MAEGALDGPVKSEYGYHIVRLDSVFEQGPLALEEIRSELLRELRDREADIAFRDLEGQVSDALFDAVDMQSITASVGIDVESVSGFSHSGGEPFGANQAAIDAVFDDAVLNDGQISELVELDANTSAIFKVTRYNEATRQTLDDVRNQIEDAIRAQAAERLMIDRAERILAAMAADEDFGQAAEAAGATVSEPQLVSRQSEDIDQAVLFEVFAAGKPSQAAPVRGRVRNITGGYTIYSLEAVLPGRPESIPLAERDARKLQLAQQSGIGDYRAFVQALYDDADVAINDNILAAQDLLQ
jgi:peptidyl-prolyl cis-trans isomerase D